MAQIIELANYRKIQSNQANPIISRLKNKIQTILVSLDPLCEYFDSSIKRKSDDYIVEFFPKPGQEKVEYYNAQFLLVGASIHVHCEVEQCIINIENCVQEISTYDVQSIQLKLIEDLDRNSLIKLFENTDWYHPYDYFALIHLIPFFENIDRIIVKQTV